MKMLIQCLAICLFFACGESAKAPEKAPEPTKPTIKISAFPNSPAFEDATMTKMSYSEGKFDFDYTSENYKLGEQTDSTIAAMCANSGKGQHIHLIVDKEPYAAKYTEEFEYDLPDGEHHVLAFLSRSYHESIKNGKAFMAKKVMVKDKSITKAEAIEKPALFYSRPKGTYVGKNNTDKILLDYFLVNVAPDAGYKVMAKINGEEHDLGSEWKPMAIEGLPMGNNTIELRLVDSEGKLVDAAVNQITREFTLKEDPTEKK